SSRSSRSAVSRSTSWSASRCVRSCRRRSRCCARCCRRRSSWRSCCRGAQSTCGPDATQLQQVLMNLGSNAWHALPERGGRIVVAHGGAIGLTTEVGRGTTFDLYLPLVDHESRPMPLAGPAEERSGQGQQVLYVDDDEVMATLVGALLERLGYRATCFHDSQA